MSTKARRLLDFGRHKMFALGFAGVSQSVLYLLVWNYWAASAVAPLGASAVAGLMLAGIVFGGCGFLAGAFAIGCKAVAGKGRGPNRVSAASMAMQALLACAVPASGAHPFIPLALFGMATGAFYAGRNSMEVSQFESEGRDVWLAGVGVAAQAALLLTPLFVAALAKAQQYTPLSDWKVAFPVWAFAPAHLWAALRLWRLDLPARQGGGVSAVSVARALGALATGPKGLLFAAEGFFWCARLFSYPVAAGLLIGSVAGQGMWEAAAALASVAAGAGLVKRWSPASRSGFMALALAPILASWVAAGLWPCWQTAALVLCARALFAPFADTAIRAMVLDGAQGAAGEDGLENLCARELWLIAARGGLLLALAWHAQAHPDKILQSCAAAVVLAGGAFLALALRHGGSAQGAAAAEEEAEASA